MVAVNSDGARGYALELSLSYVLSSFLRISYTHKQSRNQASARMKGRIKLKSRGTTNTEAIKERRMVLESGGGGDALRRKRRKGGVQGDDGRLLSERGSVECIIRNERINNTNGNSVSMMHQK